MNPPKIKDLSLKREKKKERNRKGMETPWSDGIWAFQNVIFRIDCIWIWKTHELIGYNA